ncbi:hypothetical protein COU13_00355 [Candidatus Kaiserbacteria bacterium CG10_big_fil_rev_8_21_14_0_10_43_70]|uniref:Uncharacterized protein n=1 Tax=Candidatus Kaiserbacteria bacterium CG10_big_fil_rev_8_21_14_0_10_43_70 TaxID=1974605 RepID=A0A2H0ULB0_9BACT|nr:MAG: hypothetical protein COU13_00355 [Candidatus Kaiserbacteria bacterium CG10_big_fil_rev_8_21_14_0_10_43_70]
MEVNEQKEVDKDIRIRTSDEARSKFGFMTWVSVASVLILIFLFASFLVGSKDSGDSFIESIWKSVLKITLQKDGLSEPELLSTLLEETRTGDYESAIEIYNQVLESNPSSSELANAVRNSVTARYKTGGTDEYLDAIRDLKAVVADKSASLNVRIQALNTLAGSYSQSGENPAIYQEIYSGEPFSQFVVPGDPIATTRNLYEWGYTAYPTAKAGVAISGLYVRDVINNPDISEAVKSDYIAKTKQYLAEAEALVNRENLLQNPESNNLAGYKVWRAFSVGALGYLGEEPYESEYEKEYKNLESDFSKISNVEALQYKPFAHWMYSTFLLLKGEPRDVVVKEIEKAVAFYNNDTNKEVNEFAEYMRNWKDKKEFVNDDFMTREVVTLMSISSIFSDFVQKI